MADATCSIDGCDNPRRYVKTGWCSMHYDRWRRHGDPGPAQRERQKPPTDGRCSIDGCSRPHRTRGWCGTHYARWRATGTTDDPPTATERFCEVDGCDRRHLARGLCGKHWARWDRYGDVNATKLIRGGDDTSRFWRRVVKTLGGCWHWTGHLERDGYGKMWATDDARIFAHRFAYELLVGPIPEGLTIDHLCRVRRCVNPAHLEPVTAAENTRREMAARAREAEQS